VVDIVLWQRHQVDGYRVNNALDQRNGVGNVNYTTPDLTAFLTLSGDDQKLGFPGGRTVDPSIGLNQLVTDRRGTNTPFDYGTNRAPTPPQASPRHCGMGRPHRRWRCARQEAAGRFLRHVANDSL